LTDGRKWLPEGPGKDIVRFPSCNVYITGYDFNCDKY